MKRFLYTSILFFFITGFTSFSQGIPYLGKINYTNTGFTVFNIDGACYGSGLKVYLNGAELPNVITGFCAYGICQFRFPYGSLKVGDVLTVKDNCGRTSIPVTVEDSYVYIEVPNGTSYIGNSITPTDESPPYTNLTTPIEVGKCEPITLNSHALHDIYMFVGTDGTNNGPFTSGVFKINGNTIKASELNIDKIGNSATNISINTNGSINYNGGAGINTKTNFSGRTVTSFEYTHNGVLPFDVQEFTFGSIGFRMWNNNRITLKEHTYNGTIEQDFTGNYTNSAFKITFGNGFFKFYIDNVEIKSVARSVIYQAPTGTLSNTALLPYATAVNCTPSSSGLQYVSAIIDGVRNVRQYFQVAEDMTISESVVNVACNGGNSGSITANVNGGQSPLSYSKNNGAFQSSNVFSGLSAGNYSIKVRDASGCETTKSISISENAVLNLSTNTKNNANCSGETNGSITLNGSGGIGTLQYGINNANYKTSNVFGSLAAGTYIFWLKDAAGCTKTLTETIGTNSTLSASVTAFQDVKCFGGNSGTITITSAGSSSGAIQYSIDGTNFVAGNVFNNLTANTYTVKVKDNLCTVNVTSQVISHPSDIAIGLSAQNISCFGGADGQITVNASGGTPTYTYSKNGTDYVSSNIFGSLGVNNYKFWVKDANACVKESGITAITQPTILEVGIDNKTDVACNSENTGLVKLKANGGTKTYQFSKDGTNFQADSSFKTLAAANYTFTIKDAKGCTKTTTSSVLQPTAIVIANPTITNLTCNGDNSGQIIVSATGGTSPYQFKKGADSFQASGTFGSLAANTYTIYAKDANSCIVSIATIVNEPTIVSANITITNNLCNNDQTGQIVALGNGGTPSYQYSKDGVSFVSSGTFGTLSAGSYTIKTKDSRGCLNSQNVTVNQPTVLGATPSITKNVTCFGGNDGTINVLASGGTSPYQYSSNGTAYQSGANFSFVIGTYSFWVKDANGCIKTTGSLTVTQPTDIAPSLTTKTAVSCFGGSNGTATIAATGGVSPYTFAKDGTNFQTSGAFTDFAAGTFSLTVKDNSGCTKPISVQILQPAQALQVSISSQTNISCYQNNTGSLQAALSGGTGPYQFSKDNTTFQTSGAFTALAAGNYTIYGKDANNCQTNIGLTLTEPSNTSISLLQKQDVACEANTQGFFKVGASGGTGGFSYSLSGIDFNGNGLPTASNNSGYFDNLKIGNYTVNYQDQNACSKSFPVTIISKNSPIRFDIAKNLPSDCATGNGSITVNNARGGQGNYVYRISSQSAASGSNIFSNLQNGSYFITVTDNLCAYTEAVNLELPNSIKATYTINPISCQLPTANLTIDNITGGNGGYSLAIDGTNFSANRTFNNLAPNTYAVTIQDSPLSCKSVVSLEIKEQNRADLKVSTLGNISCFGGNNGFINAIGDNNMGPFSYAINNGAFSSNGNFGGLSANTYKISAQTRIGCIDSIRVTLTQPTLLQSNISLQSNLCNGDQTGKISIIGTGGMSPYQYTIDGSTYQAGNDFTTLFAGNYTVTVKDNNGCTFAQNQNLTQPTLVTTASSVVQEVSCFAGNDGKGQVIGSGGTLPYTFSINGTNFVSSNVFDGLSANTYKFWVKDANGCTKTSTVITVSQPTLLVPSVATFSNALCNGSSDGTITLAATGGTSPYQYSKDNNSYQNPTLLTAFPAGNFTVYVKDSKGCVKTTTQNITQPAPLSLNLVAKSDLTCFENETGKFEVGINGGTKPYRYSLDNSSFQTSPIFANLKSGNYNITGKDLNNCTFLLSTSLSEPALLTATFMVKTNDCFGDQTGKINTFATGGTMPYEYSLNNQTYQPSTEFDKLFAGNYLATIRDKNACIFNQNVEVKQPEELKLFPINQDLIRCFGEANGSILINTTGGTPKLIYSLDDKIYEDKPLFQNLKVGKYLVFVKDGNQCFKQSEITLKEPDKLKMSIVKQADPLCAGEQNGIIEVKAVGGNGGYTFIRDNIIENQTGLFDKLTQAEYTFKVLDAKKCEDNIEKVVLKWPIALTATIDKVITPACVGDANGAILLSLKGGILPYTSNLISEPLNAKPLVNNTITYDKLLSGNYQISLQDANGCQLQTSVKVPIPDKLNAIDFTTLLPKEVCKGQQLTLNANNPKQTIQWFLNGNTIITSTNTQISKDLQELTTSLAGKYSVSVKNTSGCEVKADYELVNNDKALKVDFLLPTEAFVGDTIVALDITKPIPDEIIWILPTDSYVNSNLKDRISFIPYYAGDRKVTMIARSGDCKNLVTRDIKIFEKSQVKDTDDPYQYKQKELNKVEVSPNPNYGAFGLKITFNIPNDFKIKLIKVNTGEVILNESFTKDKIKNNVFEKQFDLTVIGGIYSLVIQAAESQIIKNIAIIN